jgi:hypothetical protein
VKIRAPQRKDAATIEAERLEERQVLLAQTEAALEDSRRRSAETLMALRSALAQAKADHDARVLELRQIVARLTAEIVTLQEQKAMVEAKVAEKLEALGRLE